MNPINVQTSHIRKRYNRKVKNHAKRIQQLKAKQRNLKERQQIIGNEEQNVNGCDNSQDNDCKEKKSSPDGHIHRTKHRERKLLGKRHNKNGEKLKLKHVKKRTDRRYRTLENRLEDLQCTEFSNHDQHKRTTSPDIDAQPLPLEVICNIQINGYVKMPTSSYTTSKVRLKNNI